LIDGTVTITLENIYETVKTHLYLFSFQIG